MFEDRNKNINDLIELIERNKYSINKVQSDESEEDDDEADDYSGVRLLIFATEGPFTDSLLPMFDQHDLEYAITDEPDEVIDIAMNNPQIRHVLIDLDRPTNPAKGMNVFADIRTLNPGIIIYYCTKNPMSMESRNLQTKGAKLLQKPILRKTVDQFYMDNFRS